MIMAVIGVGTVDMFVFICGSPKKRDDVDVRHVGTIFKSTVFY